jgi:hypothetical protein
MLLLSSIPSGALLPGRRHRIREDVPSVDEMNIDVESDYNRRVDEELTSVISTPAFNRVEA